MKMYCSYFPPVLNTALTPPECDSDSLEIKVKFKMINLESFLVSCQSFVRGESGDTLLSVRLNHVVLQQQQAEED